MNKSIVVLGKFDGIHIGHKKLLETAINLSDGHSRVVYTFANSDRTTLMTDDEKEKELLKYGFDKVYFEKFTDEFKKTAPEAFVRDILKGRLSAEKVVVGYNYRFGRDASGDVDMLGVLCEKYGISLFVVGKVSEGGERVSSTRIRACIEDGDLPLANQLLGRKYTVSSHVVSGKRLGRHLGFPTVNFNVLRNKVMPQRGVYITETEIDGKIYRCVTNFGYNPTVENTDYKKMETHIIDFCGDLYGKEMEIAFIKKIRDEIKFASADELIRQLENDIACALSYEER